MLGLPHRIIHARVSPGAPAPWWAYILAGLFFGVFMALAFPPVCVWPLSLAAIIPLVWAGCRGAEHAKWTAFLTALGTLPFWTFEHTWMWNVTAPGCPALCVYLSLYPGLFVWATAHARRADWPIPMFVVVPFVWTALEMARAEFVLDGYAFFLLGHPLIDSPILAAPAGVFGAYAVSFLCAALAGAVADAAGWSGISRSFGGAGAGALLVVWPGLGLLGTRSDAPASATRTIRIGVVQTNLPQDNKMSWGIDQRVKDEQRFLDLTRQTAALHPAPDLITWPETSFPGIALNPEAIEQLRAGVVTYKSGLVATQFSDDLLKVQAELGIPMAVGCEAVEGDLLADIGKPGPASHRRVFNSVVIVDKGQPQPTRYDKVELMPFGEVIPYLWRWPDLQAWVVNFGAAGMEFDLTPGTHLSGLDVPTPRPEFAAKSVRIAMPICFEVTRAAVCRRLVRGDGTPQGRSELLVNISNDGWFGNWDPGRRQLLLAARWRCVELGLPMVRCVNTGVSCQIDPHGRIVTEQLAEKPGPNERTEGVLLASALIPTGRIPTLFDRLGLAPAYGVMVVGLVGSLILWLRSRRVGGGIA